MGNKLYRRGGNICYQTSPALDLAGCYRRCRSERSDVAVKKFHRVKNVAACSIIGRNHFLNRKRGRNMKVRIGIDVGGTFTDAALINNDTFELVSTAKVPTTHKDKAGVAAGIVQVLREIMEKNQVKPEDVVFISHGTTQATNALLEGDVVKVGIVTIGKGIEGAKSKSDTVMGDIPLTATKSLHSENEYVEE